MCSVSESDVRNKTPRFFLRRRFFFGIWVCALVISGCGSIHEEADDVVIVVGSRQITLDELRAHAEFISGGLEAPKSHADRIRKRLAERIIGYYLILEYGRENGIRLEEAEVKSALAAANRGYTESDFSHALLREYMDFDRWRNRLEARLLVGKVLAKVFEQVPPPAYRDIERYYETHTEEFRFPRMLRFRQILTGTKEAAEDLLGRIKHGEAMSRLAKEHSIAPEAEAGGEVGWVAREHLDESMARVLFSMSPGEVSPIVRTAYGHHIFEVLSIRSPGVKALPEVLGQIEAKLLDQKRESFLDQWLRDLRTHFEVKVNQELLNRLEVS